MQGSARSMAMDALSSFGCSPDPGTPAAEDPPPNDALGTYLNAKVVPAK